MQLLFASRKADAEVVYGKTGTVTIRAKAATTNDEFVSLKQQVSDLIAVVKANYVWDSIKRIDDKMSKRMTIKTEKAKCLGQMDILVAQGHQKIINLCNHCETNLHGSVIIVGDGPT